MQHCFVCLFVFLFFALQDYLETHFDIHLFHSFFFLQEVYQDAQELHPASYERLKVQGLLFNGFWGQK